MIKPILFNTEMVQAIQDGRKTVTRRICKDGNKYTVPDIDYFCAEKRTYLVNSYNDIEHENKLSMSERVVPICVGDILWVRETWQQAHELDDCDMPIDDTERYYYAADPDDCMPSFTHWLDPNTGDHKDRMPWRPSIHMPKVAARIFLKVTDVKVEKLNSMILNDFLSEGITIREESFNDTENTFLQVRNTFEKLWDSTVKEDYQKFNANPWVWAIEFESCEKPEGWPE